MFSVSLATEKKGRKRKENVATFVGFWRPFLYVNSQIYTG
jgi:hypothetical protein